MACTQIWPSPLVMITSSLNLQNWKKEEKPWSYPHDQQIPQQESLVHWLGFRVQIQCQPNSIKSDKLAPCIISLEPVESALCKICLHCLQVSLWAIIIIVIMEFYTPGCLGRMQSFKCMAIHLFQVQFFPFCNKPIWLSHHSKTQRNSVAYPKLEGSVVKPRALSLLPMYICESRTTFAKAYGIKVRCDWELFGEHVRNLGTPLLWTCPQKTKEKMLAWKVNCPRGKWTVHSPLFTPNTTFVKKTPLSSPPTDPPTRRKGDPFTPWYEFSLVCMEILFLK